MPPSTEPSAARRGSTCNADQIYESGKNPPITQICVLPPHNSTTIGLGLPYWRRLASQQSGQRLIHIVDRRLALAKGAVIHGVSPQEIQILNIGGWSIIKELFCGVWELLHHGLPDYRDPDNREATICFRRVALSDALSYSVQREHHNIALDITRMVGGIVLRTADDAFEYCGLARVR